MTLRPLFYSDQDCRDRLKPGKPMFFNVFLIKGKIVYGASHSKRWLADFSAFRNTNASVPPYRIVVKAKPTPSPEKEGAA